MGIPRRAAEEAEAQRGVKRAGLLSLPGVLELGRFGGCIFIVVNDAQLEFVSFFSEIKTTQKVCLNAEFAEFARKTGAGSSRERHPLRS